MSSDSVLDVLATATAVVARARDLDEALEALLRAAATAVRADAATILVQDPDRAELRATVSVGIDEAGLAELTAAVTRPDHPIRLAIGAGRPAFDVAAPGGSGGSGGHAYLPLVVVHDGIDLALGALALSWQEHSALDDDHRRLALALADLTAVALDRGRLAAHSAERSEWLERMAHVDPLTGLANARAFARVLELELARAGRQGGEVSVALFDVDDFRAANAAGGTAAGDAILRQVAAVVAESVRLVDTVARSGGDEFVVVAPGTAGPTVARRVIDGVAALPDVAGRRVRVSAGVVRFPTDGSTAEELLAAARRALDTDRSSEHGDPASGEATTTPAG